ncbi:MAG: putative zinc-binding protein [Firmicutes bacterium]|nr:putative zinc-binding protein [Bacillota bacterium]
MNESEQIKVGIISCSGEEISEGTLARAAVRIAIEKLRPGKTTTICLPLFLTGDGGERAFAEKFPTITVDGCGKLCAYKATEKFSGKISECINITEILEALGEPPPASRRNYTDKDWDLAHRVAEIIARTVDKIIEAVQKGEITINIAAPVPPVCSGKSRSAHSEKIKIGNLSVNVALLDMIIELTASRTGLSEGEKSSFLIRQAKIYNSSLNDFSDDELKKALMEEYHKRRAC